MRTRLPTGFWGIALVATAVALGGCGGSSDGATDPEPTPKQLPGLVIGHRLGPARVEPGEQLLPARPCATVGSNGTMTVSIFSEAGPCVRVAPGERLLFVNDTGIGPQHAGATPVRVRIGGYELWIEPRGSGLIRAPVETYLGLGSHPVRVAGAPGATVLLLPPGCAIRAPVAPSQELCFSARSGRK